MSLQFVLLWEIDTKLIFKTFIGFEGYPREYFSFMKFNDAAATVSKEIMIQEKD